MRSKRGHGFTMIELLVVVAIVGVLVGLLLPAVQSTREAARATSCKNNLLNLHLAIECYQSAFDVFPAGTVTDRLPARMFPDGKDHSWLVQIRPFMAGGLKFSEKWSPIHSAYHPKNWKLATMGPPALACPSSPYNHRDGIVPLSYVGIHDGSRASIDGNSDGFFIANRFLRRQDIADGLSQTLQLGEIPVDVSNTFFWITGNQSTLRSTGIAFWLYSHRNRWWGAGSGETRTRIAYGRFADPARISYQELIDELGETKLDPDSVDPIDSVDSGRADSAPAIRPEEIDAALIKLWEDSAAEAIQPPASGNGVIPQYTIPKLGLEAERSMSLGSQHVARVHGVFADGRTVSIHASIDSSLLKQIGKRNDAQPLEKPLMQTQ